MKRKIFTELNHHQLTTKKNYIWDYVEASNAANGSLVDANANVSQKNVATLMAELNKDTNIQIARSMMVDQIGHMFGEELAHEYIRQIDEHEIYVHDESGVFMPYCVSISMYPLLIDGMKRLGGESGPPQHLTSFCGSFVNLIFAVSSQYVGAVAAVETLMYFDHFARKDYGDDYLNTHTSVINNHLQHIVYSINQPAAARGYQSVFFNMTIYDREYFNGMFSNFYFPDGSVPNYDSIARLQEYFMTWFNNERSKTILTFPVITAAMLVDDLRPLDEDFAQMCSKQLAEGNSFFVYTSDSADSLSSCCRLRSELDNKTFSSSSGAMGVATGSIKVITMNINRLIQSGKDIRECVSKVHKYHAAFRKIVEKFKSAGMLTVYDAGFISLNKQFSTIGINGFVEAAEYLGYKPGNNEEYKGFLKQFLSTIEDENKVASSEFGFKFNTEAVPGENLSAKNAGWDRKDGLVVSRETYSSYFYAPECEDTNIVDKFVLHGGEIAGLVGGGQALHLNLETYLTQQGFYDLICLAARCKTNYFCTNVAITICNVCGHIDKNTVEKCPICSSVDLDYATRIIGYLKRISSWSSPRQKEHGIRHYH